MYNTIQLRREHWVFQQYLWENSLDPAKQCQDKVIKTIISRVRSSGSQAERALRMTTEISRYRYPQIYEIISRHIYVDDCISGLNSENEMLNIADKLEFVLNSDGFSLKGIVYHFEKSPMGQCHSWLYKSTVDIKLWNDEQIQDIDPQGSNSSRWCCQPRYSNFRIWWCK